MKKICALVLLFGSLAVAPGCGENCGKDSKPYFDVTGMTASNIFKLDGFNSDYNILQDSVITVASGFGIELRAQTRYYSLAYFTGGLGAAFACSPLLGNKGSMENMLEIVITSNSDFDSSHPAGSNLNEFFNVSAYNNDSAPHDSLFQQVIPLNVLLTNGSKARQKWQLWLTQRPETVLSHRFTVVYRQTNGEEYVVTTPPVTFQ